MTRQEVVAFFEGREQAWRNRDMNPGSAHSCGERHSRESHVRAPAGAPGHCGFLPGALRDLSRLGLSG